MDNDIPDFSREQMEDTLCLNFSRVEIYFEQDDSDETFRVTIAAMPWGRVDARTRGRRRKRFIGQGATFVDAYGDLLTNASEYLSNC